MFNQINERVIMMRQTDSLIYRLTERQNDRLSGKLTVRLTDRYIGRLSDKLSVGIPVS